MGPDEYLEEDVEAEEDDQDTVQNKLVSINKSPELHVFHGTYPLRLTLDSGAESNTCMISSSVTQYIEAKIVPSRHKTSRLVVQHHSGWGYDKQICGFDAFGDSRLKNTSGTY